MSDKEPEMLLEEAGNGDAHSEAAKKKKKKKKKGKKHGEERQPLVDENGAAGGEAGAPEEEESLKDDEAARRKAEAEELQRLGEEIASRKKAEEEERARRLAEANAKAEAEAKTASKKTPKIEEPETAKEGEEVTVEVKVETEATPTVPENAQGGESESVEKKVHEDAPVPPVSPTITYTPEIVKQDEADPKEPKGKEPIQEERIPTPKPASSPKPNLDTMPHEQRMQLQRQDTYERAKAEVRVSDADIDRIANFEKHKHVVLRKRPEESLGFMITETGRTSLLPCIFISHVFPGGAAARCGELFVGDHIVSVNDTSVVGLPFNKVLDVFRAISHLEKVELMVIPVEPVVSVTVDRKNSKNGKLGFDVLHGEVISVDKDGPADIAGLKAGHRITEVNGTSVVDFTHEQIVQSLQSERVELKTMPRDLFQTLMTPMPPPTN